MRPQTRNFPDDLLSAGASFLAEPLDGSRPPGTRQSHTSRILRQYIFVEEGRAIGFFRDGQIALQAGAVMMIPPAIDWSIEVKPGTRGVWLAATEDFLIASLAALSFLPPPTRNDYEAPNVYASMVGPAGREMRGKIMTDLMAARRRLSFAEASVGAYMMVTLTAAMLGRSSKTLNGSAMTPVHDADARLLLDFRSVIERHHGDKLSVRQYAAKLGVSVDRLARACQTAGGTPLSLLTARAVRKAKVELLYSRDPIASIGYRLGFPNPGYFSQFFKRHTSYSPSEYRATFGRPETDAADAALRVTVEKIAAE